MTVVLERPATATPWVQRDLRHRLVLGISVVIPAIVMVAATTFTDLPNAVIVPAIYLPIQLVASVVAALVTRGKRGVADSGLRVIVFFSVALVSGLLGSLLWSLVSNGYKVVTLHFLGWDSKWVTPSTSLEYGGVGHAIVGSLLVVLLSTIITIPFGLAIAIYLTETRGRMRGSVRFIIQSMSGLPSIVSGLFIYAMLILPNVFERSGLMAALALSLLMLPTVARMAEEVLKLVPAELRNAAVALGAPRRAAFFQVVMPAARTGLVTALLLGLARIIGETAPLLMTTLRSDSTNYNIFSGNLTLLPTYINAFVTDPHDTSQHRAWGAALVLLMMVGIIFSLARLLTSSKTARKR